MLAQPLLRLPGAGALGRVGLGLLAGLGQAPWDLPALTMLALIGLMLWQSGTGRGWRAFADGWLVGVGYFALTLHWIVEPFLVEPERDGWMAPFALVLMVAGMALFWGLAFWFACRLAPRPGLHRILALVLGLALIEMLRSFVFTGFPWVLIGHVLVDTPFAQLSAFVGPHGLGLLVLGGAASVAAPLRRGGRGRGLALLPALLVALCWPLLAPGPTPPADPAAPVIRLVQPNAPQHEKWDPALAPVFQARLVEFTGAGARPDLVVWPETAIPYLMEYAADQFEAASDAARGAPLVTGLNRREGSRYHNSLVVLGPSGVPGAIYDKVHLVPFGEYIPFGEVFARWGIHGLAASEGGGFTPGPGPQIITLPGIGPVLPLICYEGVFAEAVSAAPERPRLLLLITNDAWFGPGAGPYQHLAQARLRAIEQGLPMVRVANTGVSAMIDGRGRLIDPIGLGEAGWRDVALPPDLGPTLYSRWGNRPVLLVLAALALALGVLRRRISH